VTDAGASLIAIGKCFNGKLVDHSRAHVHPYHLPGLLWWHIIIAATVGSLLCAALAVLNSRGASRYHIGFPSFVRVSVGLRGSLFFVFIRGVVAGESP
jgi:hypothetical protein